MSKKIQKQTKPKGGKRGRKSIESKDDPVIEGRLDFVAKLLSQLKPRRKILEECKNEGWGIDDRQIDKYCEIVRSRWKEENKTVDYDARKAEYFEVLKDIYQKASEKKSRTELGCEYENPDHWLMRQIIMDLMKVEGLIERKTVTNDELNDVLDELSGERTKDAVKAGIEGRGLSQGEVLQTTALCPADRGDSED